MSGAVLLRWPRRRRGMSTATKWNRGCRRNAPGEPEYDRIRAAMTTADALPEDMPGLRFAALALIAERDDLLRHVERMRQIIRQFQRAQFGRHSGAARRRPVAARAGRTRDCERSHPGGSGKADDSAASESRVRRTQIAAGASAVVEIVIEPETTSCPCCGGAMHVIGEEKSERIDVIPAQHRILVTRRPKYGCRACASAVVQAPAPERLIRAGLPTEAMVAHVLVSKYAWHLPLYRQVQILLAQGIEIDRSVLAFWVGYAAAELMPLWRHLREILLGSPRLFVDETRAPVLDPGRGRTKTGYFWSIARDDSAWHGSTGPPAVVYTYAPGRGAKHARMLLGFAGASPSRSSGGQFRSAISASPYRTIRPRSGSWSRSYLARRSATACCSVRRSARTLSMNVAIETELRGQG
jgi:transposase